MLTTYQTLKAAIKTKLEALQGGGSPAADLFADVYEFPTTAPAGYPYALLVEDGGEGEIIDTHRNERRFDFGLTIVQEIGNRTPAAAQTVIIDAVDRVLTAFDQDPYLLDENDQMQVLWIKVLPAEFTYGVDKAGQHIASLRITAVSIVNRYTQS